MGKKTAYRMVDFDDNRKCKNKKGKKGCPILHTRERQCFHPQRGRLWLNSKLFKRWLTNPSRERYSTPENTKRQATERFDKKKERPSVDYLYKEAGPLVVVRGGNKPNGG